MDIPGHEFGIHKSRRAPGDDDKDTQDGQLPARGQLGQTQLPAQVSKGLTFRNSWGKRVEMSNMGTWLQANDRQGWLLGLVLGNPGTLDYRTTAKIKSGPRLQATETEGRCTAPWQGCDCYAWGVRGGLAYKHP